MRTLADTDCRGLGDRLIEQMEGMSVFAAREFVAKRKGKASSGETKYELPWIWYRKGPDEDEDGLKITDGQLSLTYTFPWRVADARYARTYVGMAEESSAGA